MKGRAISVLLLLALVVSLAPAVVSLAQGINFVEFRAVRVLQDLLVDDDATVADDVTINGDLIVGNGTPGVTQNGEDAYIEGTFEVDGAVQLDGTLTTNSTVTANGAVTANAGVIIAADSTGGNAGAKNELAGLPRVKMVALSTMTNGSTNTLALTDDTPAGEWAAHDADTVVAADAVIYRVGSNSLAITFTVTADAGDGAHDGVSYDFTDDESVGGWVRCNTTLAAGDIVFDITDSGAGATATNLPALSAANVWTWLEVDISGVANASKDVISDISLELSAAGAAKAAAGAFKCYFDWVYKWDAADEEALNTAILQDGVLSVLTIATAAGSANTPAMAAEATDFFVHYETGSDFIVTMTNQSANSGVALIAY